MKEFSVELAKPAAEIMNSILRTGIYPEKWKMEYVTPIPKIHPPENEEDLRNISLTAFLSKIFEGFILKWLFPHILPFMDPGQMGGLKGCSTTHYLVNLFHFIYTTGDMPPNLPHAVLLGLVDYSKAFNRIDHTNLIKILAEYKVPTWLLIICIGYLTNRRMIVRFKGKNSTERKMPGGGPQGTLLGVFFFLILINKAGWPKETSPNQFILPSSLETTKARLKYVDDLTFGSTVNLKKKLCSSIDKSGPRNFHDRFGFILPQENSDIQNQLDDLVDFSSINQMKMNEKKTKIMPFNLTKKVDFVPSFKLKKSKEPLDVVYETKLLGIICTSNAKWRTLVFALSMVVR